MQSLQAERTKQNNLAERLQERLSRAQEEISSLQSSMAQRASHYQSLHTELLDKVSRATDTEKEVIYLIFSSVPFLIFFLSLSFLRITWCSAFSRLTFVLSIFDCLTVGSKLIKWISQFSIDIFLVELVFLSHQKYRYTLLHTFFLQYKLYFTILVRLLNSQYFFFLYFYLCFPSVEKKKCTCGFAGETVTGENLSLQPGCTGQHRAWETATGTAQWHFQFYISSMFCFFSLMTSTSHWQE